MSPCRASWANSQRKCGLRGKRGSGVTLRLQNCSENDLLTLFFWDLEMACLPSELQWSCGVRAVREGTMSAEASKDLLWLVIRKQMNHCRIAFCQSQAGLGSKEKRRGTETTHCPSDVRCSGDDRWQSWTLITNPLLHRQCPSMSFFHSRTHISQCAMTPVFEDAMKTISRMTITGISAEIVELWSRSRSVTSSDVASVGAPAAWNWNPQDAKVLESKHGMQCMQVSDTL